MLCKGLIGNMYIDRVWGFVCKFQEYHYRETAGKSKWNYVGVTYCRGVNI